MVASVDPSAARIDLSHNEMPVRSAGWLSLREASGVRSSPRYRAPLRPLTGLRTRLVDGLCRAAEQGLERGDAASAEQSAASALSACDQLAPGLETDQRRLRALASLGEAHRLAGRFTYAEGSLTAALELAESSFPEGAPERRTALYALAAHYKQSGRFEAAEALHRRALAIHPRIEATRAGFSALGALGGHA